MGKTGVGVGASQRVQENRRDNLQSFSNLK